ncbi:hypothetical protein [Natronospora cellulosivora (SeqCode)]
MEKNKILRKDVSKMKKNKKILLLILLVFLLNSLSFSLTWEVNFVDITEREETIINAFNLEGYFAQNISLNEIEYDRYYFLSWLEHYKDGEQQEKMELLSVVNYAFANNMETLYLFFAEEELWRISAFDNVIWGGNEEAKEFSDYNKSILISREDSIEYEGGDVAAMAIGIASEEEIYMDEEGINWNDIEKGIISEELMKNDRLYIFLVQLGSIKM